MKLICITNDQSDSLWGLDDEGHTWVLKFNNFDYADGRFEWVQMDFPFVVPTGLSDAEKK